MKILILSVHAGLFWCFHKPSNSDMDYVSLTCVCDVFCMCIHTGELGWQFHPKEFLFFVIIFFCIVSYIL